MLYGKDIRDQFPETKDLNFDYDDILARGLYHIYKSIGDQDLPSAKKERSKGIFKFAFYFCIFFAPRSRKTPIIENGNKLQKMGGFNEHAKKITF